MRLPISNLVLTDILSLAISKLSQIIVEDASASDSILEIGAI